MTTSTTSSTIVLGELAQSRGISTSQLAIAWALSKGEAIVPVLGARKRTQLSEALDALSVQLKPEDLWAMEALGARRSLPIRADGALGQREVV